MRKYAKNQGKTMLLPALQNRKPHGDVSDMERSKETPSHEHQLLAIFSQYKCFMPMRSISNASALAHGANDLAFPPAPPPVLPSHRTSLIASC